ncbi:MAG: hypothetical protein B7Z46_01335 [Hydrogenophilales bacterium 12-64-6]|nr:MAG: hypothetical protein B7Z46_01335 [Hydrogenophilales bacterium 12-64-6]
MRNGHRDLVLAWQARGACTAMKEDDGGPWPELVRPMACMHHGGLPESGCPGKGRYTQMRRTFQRIRSITGAIRVFA